MQVELESHRGAEEGSQGQERDHSFSTYAKSSEKLTFLTP